MFDCNPTPQPSAETRRELSGPAASHGAAMTIDCLLREVYLGMSSAIGEEFFCYLLRYIGRVVHADFAFIGEFADEKDSMLKTLAALREGEIVDNFEFKLAGTPCETVLKQGARSYQEGGKEWLACFPFGGMGAKRFLGRPLVDYSGRVVGIIALIWARSWPESSLPETLLDIFSLRLSAELERDRSIKALERQLHFLQVVVDAIPNPIFYKDTDYRYLGCNVEFEKFFGLNRAQLIGKSVFEIAPGDLACHYNEKDLEVTEKGGIQVYEGSVERVDGSRREVIFRKANFTHADGTSGGIVGTIADVTDLRKAEQEAYLLANYDSLTGLPNRVLFEIRLAQALESAKRDNQVLALLLLDMDYYKDVNETWGHSACNQMLKAVGERLSRWSGERDVAARVGGDKFAVLLCSIAREEDAASVSLHLLNLLSRPIRIMGHEMHCTGSIGIALYPHNGESAETLLKNADTALYQGKKKGRGGFQFFTETMNFATRDRLEMERSLRQALIRNEFSLCYQPQVDLRSGVMVGVEALIRWRHPEKGMVPPDSFIRTAEESSLILPIGQWVLKTACAQNQAWRQAGHPPVRVAVNISGVQLKQPDFIDVVLGTLRETGLDPDGLELELTETTMMTDTEETLRILGRLKKMGVHLSIDDFGTGYSSLDYLKRFPVDKLKMDRSYVGGIPTVPHDVAIAEAILAMASGLGLKVLAEGVETEEQVEFLRARNCDKLQGYYFGRPMPAEEVEKLFDKIHKESDSSRASRRVT